MYCTTYSYVPKWRTSGCFSMSLCIFKDMSSFNTFQQSSTFFNTIQRSSTFFDSHQQLSTRLTFRQHRDSTLFTSVTQHSSTDDSQRDVYSLCTDAFVVRPIKQSVMRNNHFSSFGGSSSPVCSRMQLTTLISTEYS
jgi:hypothetical protein